jgi:hypothetical protein
VSILDLPPCLDELTAKGLRSDVCFASGWFPSTVLFHVVFFPCGVPNEPCALCCVLRVRIRRLSPLPFFLQIHYSCSCMFRGTYFDGLQPCYHGHPQPSNSSVPCRTICVGQQFVFLRWNCGRWIKFHCTPSQVRTDQKSNHACSTSDLGICTASGRGRTRSVKGYSWWSKAR